MGGFWPELRVKKLTGLHDAGSHRVGGFWPELRVKKLTGLHDAGSHRGCGFWPELRVKKLTSVTTPALVKDKILPELGLTLLDPFPVNGP